MAGPMTDEERDSGNRKLRIVFVLLITASAVGITLQTDASTVQIGAAALVGLAVGIVLSWYVTRTLREFRRTHGR